MSLICLAMLFKRNYVDFNYERKSETPCNPMKNFRPPLKLVKKLQSPRRLPPPQHIFLPLPKSKTKTLLVLVYQHVHKLTRARPFFFLRLTKYTISRSIFEPQKSITYQKNCIFSEHCQKLFLFRECSPI